jgi:carbamoyltransferase
MSANFTLGLGGSDHEFSAALMRDCEILVAIEQERLSRRKHGFSFWFEDPVRKSIDYCLEAEGISLSDISEIVTSDVMPVRVQYNLRNHQIKLYPHHLCHAASAYLMLPNTARAGIIVYDGFGSTRERVADDPNRNYRETFSFFLFGPDGYQSLGSTLGIGFIEDDYPTSVTNSIGLLYELVTSLLGNNPTDSGKTMGLSSHGIPRYLNLLENFVSYGNTPSACFSCSINDPDLISTINNILLAGHNSFAVKADLAASVQALINKTLVHCERFFRGYDIDFLCVAGGCGLNTVANSFLVENSTLNVPIFIPPHCDDAGIGFGALWLEQFHKTNKTPQITFRGNAVNPQLSRPGKLYTREECRHAVQEFYPRLALDASVISTEDIARIIASGEIIAVFNGRSEIGPRALGGRSIIADPSSAMIREKINRLIKKREPYRPLAPIVLESDYNEYFEDIRNADTFMLKIAKARARCLREAPAAVHVDGTARVQVVTKEGDSFLVELLQAFRKLTGRSLLLNTSFNRRGEPIVESPLDAIDAFLGMTLDGLYLEGEFYRSAVSMSPNS